MLGENTPGAQVAFRPHLSALHVLADRNRAALFELDGRNVYVSSEIATVYLRDSPREVQLEFSPKELPMCESKTEIMRVVSGYGSG